MYCVIPLTVMPECSYWKSRALKINTFWIPSFAGMTINSQLCRGLAILTVSACHSHCNRARMYCEGAKMSVVLRVKGYKSRFGGIANGWAIEAIGMLRDVAFTP